MNELLKLAQKAKQVAEKRDETFSEDCDKIMQEQKQILNEQLKQKRQAILKNIDLLWEGSSQKVEQISQATQEIQALSESYKQEILTNQQAAKRLMQEQRVIFKEMLNEQGEMFRADLKNAQNATDMMIERWRIPFWGMGAILVFMILLAIVSMFTIWKTIGDTSTALDTQNRALARTEQIHNIQIRTCGNKQICAKIDMKNQNKIFGDGYMILETTGK